jgi:hypothetical protein
MSRPPLTPGRLIAARNRRATHITSLLKCVSSYPGEVIWIFEGKDVKYYGSRISTLLGTRPRAIVAAGGKQKALDVLAFAEGNPDLSTNRFACLVDRDFDTAHPNSSNLYVTPCYSVENLYATDGTIEAVLQGCFDMHAHEFEREIRRIAKQFAVWRKAFVEAVRELNAWISVQKSKPGYALNLNSVAIDKLVSIQWTGTQFRSQKNYTVKTLKTLFPKAAPVTAREVKAEQMSRFPRFVDCSQIRGKYLAEFMFSVINVLIRDARDRTPKVFTTQRTVTQQVSKINFLSDLCAYADTPPCLRTFIARYA